MTFAEAKDRLALNQYNMYFDQVCFRRTADEAMQLLDEAAELYARSKWDEACEAQREVIEKRWIRGPSNDENFSYKAIYAAPKPEFKP